MEESPDTVPLALSIHLWSNTVVLDCTTLEVDQYASLAFLVSVYPDGWSSAADLDTGSALSSPALVGGQELAADMESLEAHGMYEIHEAAPDVE